jgi:hypothetical protein
VSLDLRDVNKRYATGPAVSGVSFEVPRGAMFGLLGPHGGRARPVADPAADADDDVHPRRAGLAAVGEVVLSIALLLATIALVLVLAAKVYRVALLLHGTRPGLRGIARLVRSS